MRDWRCSTKPRQPSSRPRNAIGKPRSTVCAASCWRPPRSRQLQRGRVRLRRATVARSTSRVDRARARSSCARRSRCRCCGRPRVARAKRASCWRPSMSGSRKAGKRPICARRRAPGRTRRSNPPRARSDSSQRRSVNGRSETPRLAGPKRNGIGFAKRSSSAWQRVRVAGSFLPIYGPLPPSTQVVPSEVLKPDGTVDDRATAALLEISLPVTLSRQQIREEDLSSALLQFRRRATQLGQLEDWFIFNGTYPSIELFANARRCSLNRRRRPGSRTTVQTSRYLKHLTPREWAPMNGTPTPIAGVNQNLQKEGMRQRNPGALGLIEGPRVKGEEKRPKVQQARQTLQRAHQARRRVQQARQALDEILSFDLDNDGLMQAIVSAINSLEEQGYVAPYVCVFGRNPFEAAFTSIDNSTVLPRDRIEPLIGRELLHASAIDVPPHRFDLYKAHLGTKEWRSRGVLLSMADEPIDLALAAEATAGVQASGPGRPLRVLRLRALCPPNQGRQGYRAPEVQEAIGAATSSANS